MDNTLKRTAVCFLGLLLVAGCAAYATNMRSIGDAGGAERSLSSSMDDFTKQVALPVDAPTSGFGTDAKSTSGTQFSWEKDGFGVYCWPDTGGNLDIINGDSTSANADNIIYDQGGAVFNNQKSVASEDFIVRSRSNDYMFFVDEASDEIGINTNSPAGFFHILASGTAAGSNDLIVQDSGSSNTAGVQLLGSTSGSSEVIFGDSSDTSNAYISCDNSADDLTIAADDDIVVNAVGDVIVNDAGQDSDFRIEGQNDNNIFYVDAGNDRMGVSTATPNSTFTVEGCLGLYATTKTSGCTLGNECIVFCDTASGGFTLDLPAASGLTGRVYIFIFTTSSSNNACIDPYDSETIDGNLSLDMGADAGEHLKLNIVCDGSNWHIISQEKAS